MKGVKRIAAILGAVGLAAVIAVGLSSNAFASNGGTEHFLIVTSSQYGPGAIFARGAFYAGGKDYPGNNVDLAVFPNGAFSIDHHGAKVKFHFNPKTCQGTLTGKNIPFTLLNGYGAYKKISGSGLADLNAKFTTTRKQNGTCSGHFSSFAEIINANAHVSFK